MCGIAGFIDFNKQSSRNVLISMTDSMIHRGPDGSGYEIYDFETCNIGFGQRRLAIIDLRETGKQPMHFKHLSITFNGEIYNYKEIKQVLKEKGYVFNSTSDTEVILKSFDAWGHDAIHKLNGMFAFALFDSKENKVHLYRDRAGVKPLYYFIHKGLILFGSELKALHEHPNFKKELDFSALALFLQYGNIPSPYCIFKHTAKLNPGHFLSIDCTDQSTSITQYWNVYNYYNCPKLDLPEEELLVETESLLSSSFNYRMVADVPVGVFLSGGYDSTAVTALIQKERSDKLKTFTIGFEYEDFNEAEHAKKVALHLGTDHTEYYCTTKEAQEIIPDLPFYFDEPFGDSSAIPTILVSKLAREKVKVALSADGGDETFAGYGRYFNIINNYKKYSKIPEGIRPLVGQFLGAIPNGFFGDLLRQPKIEQNYKKLSSILKNGMTVGGFLKYSTQRLLFKEVRGIINEPIQCYSTEFDNDGELLNNNDEINQIIALDYKTYLVDDILTKVDRAAMSVSLEGREPLLDFRIIEFISKIKGGMKFKDQTLKYILKTIVHKYVPSEMMDRPKMGFGIPIIHWFRENLKVYFDQYLDRDYLKKQKIFNVEKITYLKNQYLNGANQHFEFLWFVLSFQLWYDRWFD